MALQFYNAWVGVMGEPMPAKLLCTSHVDKVWKEELCKKIGDLKIAADAYKTLRTVLKQTNETLFQDCLDGLMRKLEVCPKTSKFLEYFIKEWIDKKSQWAYCYRRGFWINTNMHSTVFKRLYLGGKVNKRVDRCLVNLTKYVWDKGFDRLIRLTKGKLTSAQQTSSIVINRARNYQQNQCNPKGRKSGLSRRLMVPRATMLSSWLSHAQKEACATLCASLATYACTCSTAAAQTV